MTRISAVLFDVDGTLVDTNYVHAVTWWEAFRQYGHHVPMARIHRAIGMGSDKLLDYLLPGDRDRAVDDELRSAHTALYAPYWLRLRAFDGAADLLRACANRGLRVVLASSAAEREMRALRDALDAEDVLTAATSAGDAEESKPAPDILQIALERARGGSRCGGVRGERNQRQDGSGAGLTYHCQAEPRSPPHGYAGIAN